MNNLKNEQRIFLPGRKRADIFKYCLGICLTVTVFVSPHQANAGIDFFSIAENATVMFDAPSVKSGKLFVASANLPVEAVVNVEGWVKVRDSSGGLAWVERAALSDQRFVIVTVPMADVYQMADEHTELIFQAQENVVMEWLNADTPGWVRVRHRDGQSGYVKANQVWGS
ncbi:MAG: SH3 domain-containing protein [Nitrosomonas sp.]|nr:SH3 domain-containing protein [Nitrosomonas sp.]